MDGENRSGGSRQGILSVQLYARGRGTRNDVWEMGSDGKIQTRTEEACNGQRERERNRQKQGRTGEESNKQRQRDEKINAKNIQ